MPPYVAREGIEKHPGCVERWGECPHWLLAKNDRFVRSRIRGIVPFEFAGRDDNAEDYLDVLEDLVDDEEIAALIDEQKAVVSVIATSDAQRILDLIRAEAEGEGRRRVIAVGNRRLDVLG